MKTIYSALLLLIFTTFNSYSQTAFQWSYLYDNSGLHDLLETTALDNSGTYFVAGEKYNDNSTGTFLPVIANINSAGSLQFTRNFSAPYSQNPNFRGAFFKSVAADNQGNAIVAGYLDSAFGYVKAMLIKYNSSGDTAWAKFMGIGDTMACCAWNCVKLDNSGNIYVSGANFTYQFAPYFITAKYNSSGILQWVKKYAPPVAYNINAGQKCFIEFDNSGNVIIASSYSKTSSGSSQDINIMKYSPSGTQLWVNSYNGPGDLTDNAIGLALDPSNNAYIIGNSQNINYNNEITCLKYNASTGAQQWVFRTGGNASIGDDAASGISVNSYGEVYLTGTLANQNTLNDGVLIKLNSAGNEQWRSLMAVSANDEHFYDVKTDNSGTYILGLTSAGPTPIVIMKKFNSAGDSLWTTTYHSAGNSEIPKFITLGPGNTLFVSGDENFINNAGKIFVVKYTHVIVGISQTSGTIPDKFSLAQNYPNPFNPTTNIEFNIHDQGVVKISVFNSLGQKIKELVNKEMQPGSYKISFDAANQPSGVYFYKLETEGFTEVKKMVLVK